MLSFLGIYFSPSLLPVANKDSHVFENDDTNLQLALVK